MAKENEFRAICDRFRELHDFYPQADLTAEFRLNIGGGDKGDCISDYFGIALKKLSGVRLDLASGPLEYEEVVLRSRFETHQVLTQAVEIFREAGTLLPKREMERLGLDGTIKPELRWLAFVVETLRNDNLKLVERREIIEPDRNHNPHFVFRSDYLTQPLMSSIRAIRLRGLDAVEKETGPRRGNGKISTHEANLRARDILKKYPNITARELAAKIGCAVGTVSGLTSWKAVQAKRKAGHQPTAPKASAFTSTLEGAIIKKGSVLDDLVRAEDGLEPESDTIATPRSFRTHKRA
jgi:hypothetical protein